MHPLMRSLVRGASGAIRAVLRVTQNKVASSAGNEKLHRDRCDSREHVRQKEANARALLALVVRDSDEHIKSATTRRCERFDLIFVSPAPSPNQGALTMTASTACQKPVLQLVVPLSMSEASSKTGRPMRQSLTT